MHYKTSNGRVMEVRDILVDRPDSVVHRKEEWWKNDSHVYEMFETEARAVEFRDWLVKKLREGCLVVSFDEWNNRHIQRGPKWQSANKLPINCR